MFKVNQAHRHVTTAWAEWAADSASLDTGTASQKLRELLIGADQTVRRLKTEGAELAHQLRDLGRAEIGIEPGEGGGQAVFEQHIGL